MLQQTGAQRADVNPRAGNAAPKDAAAKGAALKDAIKDVLKVQPQKAWH